jgi:hypothetical protein
MQRANLFEPSPAGAGPEPSIRLARRDDDSSIEIDAASLLVQYLLDDGDVLLVLDEDLPYEEQLHLVLVRGAAIIDHVVIGAPYASGIFHEVGLDHDRLSFRFEGNAVWIVDVDHRGSRMPAGLPPGARRRGGWLARHHLSLSRADAA